MKIAVDDLSGPEIARFLEEHLRQMYAVTPAAESMHALDLDSLRRPGITFWSVRDGDALVGCGAIKRLDAGHAELKSMRTNATRKRSGIASLLLDHILAEASSIGFARLSLETGAEESCRRMLITKCAHDMTIHHIVTDRGDHPMVFWPSSASRMMSA